MGTGRAPSRVSFSLRPLPYSHPITKRYLMLSRLLVSRSTLTSSTRTPIPSLHPPFTFTCSAHIRPSSARAHPVHPHARAYTMSPNSSDPTATQATASGVKLTAHNQYKAERLLRGDMPADPIQYFKNWLETALHGPHPVKEPEAMVLSTATASGVPSSRVVLLKEVDDRGFIFFTNYDSRKGHELSENPVAALSFHWKETSKQVRAVGRVEKLSREESQAYFDSRPRGSRIGAWASEQSQPVGEEELAQRVQEFEKKFEGQEQVPCPPHWGGFRLVPL